MPSDCDAPQNAAPIASTSQRHKTARMRPIRLGRAGDALKRAQRVGERRPIPTGNPAANVHARRNSDLQIKPALGDCPPYNDHFGLVEDPYNKRIYMIGGSRCGDEDYMPTPDFSICDTSNMKWTKLTHRLIHRNPYDPFCKEEIMRAVKPLPCISYPGVTLLRMHNTSFIAIFGGYDADAERARSEIIIIDPTKREWWTLKIHGEGVGPRINPAIVAIGNCIYVFSGYRQFGDDPQPYNSYSIAEYFPDKGFWQWSTRDQPYSGSVPAGQAFQEACSVYNGTKILLTPGRMTDNEPINFTPDNSFFFHTTHKRFQPATADITGAFPKGVRWYFLSSPSAASSAFDSSVIICCFVDVPGTDDIAPEVWHLFLSPEERIECLDIKQKIWDLDSNFQGFICVDGQARILGSDREDGPNATWNTYLDIPWKK